MGRISFIMGSALALGISSNLFAYTPTVTPNGAPVRWKSGFKFDLLGNYANKIGLSETAIYDSVTRSLQRWKEASSDTVRFDYWQGNSSGTYVPSSDYNGVSSLYFASNAQGDTRLTPNVLGLTQVWYNSQTGEILEADIVLNDKDFQFTTNSKDTTGYGSSEPSRGYNRAYIENVITHELGHVFGLSHSGGLQSTMLFMESPEQAHLGCDERVAIHALYPTTDVLGLSVDGLQRGSIEGTVVSDVKAPIFGVHVLAISRRRGTVLASAVTDKNGKYRISALEPGSYFLMAEPFYAGAQALPTYYASLRSEICPGGESFGRTVLADSGGLSPQALQVGAASVVSSPPLVLQCGNLGGASVSSSTSASALASAPQIYAGDSGDQGFGVIDRFGESNGARYYSLTSLEGKLELHALSYSLYSPVQLEITLLDSQGSSVASQQRVERVYTGDSGFINYDSAIIADGLASGTYYVRVRSHSLSASLYPAGPMAVDSVPFLLLTGSVNESAPELQQSLPFNARCRSDENFARYVSPASLPAQNGSGGGKDLGNISAGFCGTVATSGKNPDGTPPAVLFGWFLPWLSMVGMAAGMARLARARRRG